MRKEVRKTHRARSPHTSRRGVADPEISREQETATPSGTAVAAEALRTGVVPLVGRAPRSEVPGQEERLGVGDPDTRALGNFYVGDETPGGSMSTPDQNGVDDIGYAYGLQDEDRGELRSGSEVLDGRDRHRAEMQSPDRRKRVR